mmetsp:Transcript_96869/g.278752  ORF Transcript_96869/g.278752 Transcript_96869/m.278752 type:complete len:265 (+) Transcript_96869:900-1694(+)
MATASRARARRCGRHGRRWQRPLEAGVLKAVADEPTAQQTREEEKPAWASGALPHPPVVSESAMQQVVFSFRARCARDSEHGRLALVRAAAKPVLIFLLWSSATATVARHRRKVGNKPLAGCRRLGNAAAAAGGGTGGRRRVNHRVAPGHHLDSDVGLRGAVQGGPAAGRGVAAVRRRLVQWHVTLAAEGAGVVEGRWPPLLQRRQVVRHILQHGGTGVAAAVAHTAGGWDAHNVLGRMRRNLQVMVGAVCQAGRRRSVGVRRG